MEKIGLNLTDGTWKRIPTNGEFYIRKNSQVYNALTKRIIKGSIDVNDRHYVDLSHRKVKKRYRTHRLVAEAFILKPSDNLEVNHIDGNHRNNGVSNLEWCTRRENVQHAWKMGLMKAKRKLTEGQVGMLKELYYSEINQVEYNLAKPFSTNWLAKCFKIHQSNIHRIISNKTYNRRN